jgi:hypothetical protein
MQVFADKSNSHADKSILVLINIPCDAAVLLAGFRLRLCLISLSRQSLAAICTTAAGTAKACS